MLLLLQGAAVPPPPSRAPIAGTTAHHALSPCSLGPRRHATSCMRLRGQCFRLGLCHLPSDRGGAWARRCRGASSLSLPSLPQAHHAPRTPALRSMLSSKCVMSPPPLPCVMGRKTASPLQGRWRVEHSKGPRQINQRSDQTSSRTCARESRARGHGEAPTQGARSEDSGLRGGGRAQGGKRSGCPGLYRAWTLT